ncbi:aminotransferase class III-fold pyridoxal phosphate-dependent enzyme, partial [Paenibacillus sepulcri]|nr:aminotransferase class III-fold pyridoxal phosphate-dependent enzyme [Paenibacillus sepulcri]
YDLWHPGEHNGTFRGNNLAFVAAAEALSYWEDGAFEKELAGKASRIEEALSQLLKEHPEVKAYRKGKGLIQGISFDPPQLAGQLSAVAFKRGVIMETSGPHDEVAKLMPPLTIESSVLEKGLAILKESFEEIVQSERIGALV